MSNGKQPNIEQAADLILQEIAQRFYKEPLSDLDLEFSDNFAEMLEKLIILHIRLWKMEDEVSATSDAYKIKKIKRKIDFICRIKRPKLLKAINVYLDAHIDKNHHKQISEEDIKFYEGYQNK
jgi:hypothetical protein